MRNKSHNRLPLNFHQTFIPERQYISAFLLYAAGGPEGKTLKKISRVTGIPMGASSGKMPAVLDYCLGMGLILMADDDIPGIKQPRLTAFGRVVHLEDPHLSDELTQLMCHMNLCRTDFGADLWYLVFNAGSAILGSAFKKATLEKYLRGKYGQKKRSPIGPLIRMYSEKAAFSKADVLSQNDGSIERKPLSLRDIYMLGYGAWIVSQLESHFPEDRQVTADDFENAVGMRSIALWSQDQFDEILISVEQKGIVSVDRQMHPFVLSKTIESAVAWNAIYDDLV